MSQTGKILYTFAISGGKCKDQKKLRKAKDKIHSKMILSFLMYQEPIVQPWYKLTINQIFMHMHEHSHRGLLNH